MFSGQHLLAPLTMYRAIQNHYYKGMQSTGNKAKTQNSDDFRYNLKLWPLFQGTGGTNGPQSTS